MVTFISTAAVITKSLIPPPSKAVTSFMEQLLIQLSYRKPTYYILALIMRNDRFINLILKCKVIEGIVRICQTCQSNSGGQAVGWWWWSEKSKKCYILFEWPYTMTLNYVKPDRTSIPAPIVSIPNGQRFLHP